MFPSWDFNDLEQYFEIVMEDFVSLDVFCGEVTEESLQDWIDYYTVGDGAGFLDIGVEYPLEWVNNILCGGTYRANGYIDHNYDSPSSEICYANGGSYEMVINKGTLRLETSWGHDITVPVFIYNMTC